MLPQNNIVKLQRSMAGRKLMVSRQWNGRVAAGSSLGHANSSIYDESGTADRQQNPFHADNFSLIAAGPQHQLRARNYRTTTERKEMNMVEMKRPSHTTHRSMVDLEGQNPPHFPSQTPKETALERQVRAYLLKEQEVLQEAGIVLNPNRNLKTLLKQSPQKEQKQRHSSVHSSENQEPEVSGVAMLGKTPQGQLAGRNEVKNKVHTSVDLINEGLNTLNKSSSKSQLAANPILKPLNNPAYTRPKRAGQGGIILSDLPPKEQQIFVPEDNVNLASYIRSYQTYLENQLPHHPVSTDFQKLMQVIKDNNGEPIDLGGTPAQRDERTKAQLSHALHPSFPVRLSSKSGRTNQRRQKQSAMDGSSPALLQLVGSKFTFKHNRKSKIFDPFMQARMQNDYLRQAQESLQNNNRRSKFNLNQQISATGTYVGEISIEDNVVDHLLLKSSQGSPMHYLPFALKSPEPLNTTADLSQSLTAQQHIEILRQGLMEIKQKQKDTLAAAQESAAAANQPLPSDVPPIRLQTFRNFKLSEEEIKKSQRLRADTRGKAFQHSSQSKRIRGDEERGRAGKIGDTGESKEERKVQEEEREEEDERGRRAITEGESRVNISQTRVGKLNSAHSNNTSRTNLKQSRQSVEPKGLSSPAKHLAGSASKRALSEFHRSNSNLPGLRRSIGNSSNGGVSTRSSDNGAPVQPMVSSIANSVIKEVVIVRKPQPRRVVRDVQKEYEQKQQQQLQKRKMLAEKYKFQPGPIEENNYKFIIMRGNNSTLIRRVLEERRPFWSETSMMNPNYNFKWAPVSRQVHFERINFSSPSFRRVVNHFEHHDEISSKVNLFRNLHVFCELNKLNVFDIVPITFIIQVDDHSFNSNLEKFGNFFKIITRELQKAEQSSPSNQDHQQQLDFEVQQKEEIQAPPQEEKKEESDQSGCITSTGQTKPEEQDLLSIINAKLTHFPYRNDRIKVTYTKVQLTHSMLQSHNLWILKVSNFNRGRGIYVFNSLETLKKLLLEVHSGVQFLLPHDKKPQEEQQNLELTPDSNERAKQIIKSSHFVIQKYVERPMLIDSRKFDVRVWVLVSWDMKVYFYREGYIRTASSSFTMSEESLELPFVHLTNNAVQKFAGDYGKFEDANQLSFPQFEQYLEKHHSDRDITLREHLVPRMKEIVKMTMQCVRKKLNPEDRQFCFELFGYDFLIDQSFKIWLIEVNTNPCLEQSSDWLRKLLPRMVDDLMKLTLDVIFPPKNVFALRKVSTDEDAVVPVDGYHLDGYQDSDNLWDFVCQIGLNKSKLRS